MRCLFRLDSLGPVGVTCAPAAVAAVSVVTPLSARAWSDSFPPIRKKPVAPASKALAIRQGFGSIRLFHGKPHVPHRRSPVWFQRGWMPTRQVAAIDFG